jgi:hypothetical protein
MQQMSVNRFWHGYSIETAGLLTVQIAATIREDIIEKRIIGEHLVF